MFGYQTTFFLPTITENSGYLLLPPAELPTRNLHVPQAVWKTSCLSAHPLVVPRYSRGSQAAVSGSTSDGVLFVGIPRRQDLLSWDREAALRGAGLIRRNLQLVFGRSDKMEDENGRNNTYILNSGGKREDSEDSDGDGCSDEEASPQALPPAGKSDKVVSNKVAKLKTKAGKSVTKKLPTNTHPSYLDMVLEALAKLKERSGSSRQAIQKYITETYGIEESKAKPYLRSALINGVNSQVLLQVKGTGASGSFKVAKKPQNSGSASDGVTSKKAAEEKSSAGESVKKTAAAERDPKKSAPSKPAAKKPGTSAAESKQSTSVSKPKAAAAAANPKAANKEPVRRRTSRK